MEGRRFVTSFFYILYFAGGVFFSFSSGQVGHQFFWFCFGHPSVGPNVGKVSEKLMSGGVAR